MPAMIDTKTCTGCGRCDRSCPLDVIYYNKDEKKAEIRYPEECWMCGSCQPECPLRGHHAALPAEHAL